MADAQTQTIRISLRKRLVRLHRSRRREKAVDYLREEAAKRMHVPVSDVRIDKDLNRLLQFKSRHMGDFSITLSREGNKAVAKSAEKVAGKQAQGAAAPAGQKAPQPAKTESKKKESGDEGKKQRAVR